MSTGSEQWFIRVRGRISGPFGLQQLKGLKARGRLSRVHEVSSDRQTWIPATSIAGLFDGPTAPGDDPAAASADPGYAAARSFDPATAAAVQPDDDWYYATDGDQQGPVTADELRQLVLKGALSSQVLVWKSGQSSWMPAADVLELGLAPASTAPSTATGSAQRSRKRWGMWILWSSLGLLILAGGTYGAFLMMDSSSGSSLRISEIESTSASDQIGQAVGLVVEGWQTVSRTGEREDVTIVSAGANFDGPYSKHEGKYQVVWPLDEECILTMKGRYKKVGNKYVPLHDGFCIGINGTGTEVHMLGNSGTCFMVSPNGYAVTNKHVIEDAHRLQQAEKLVEEIRNDGEYESVKPMIWVFFNGQQFDAEIIHVAEKHDLAILKVQGKTGSPYFSMAESVDKSTLPKGAKVYVLGYPGAAKVALTDEEADAREARKKRGDKVRKRFSESDFEFSQHDGAISKITQREQVGTIIQHNADINPGNSGGPLVTKDGRVFGVNAYSARGASGIHFSIAVDQLRDEIDRHVKPKPEWR